MNYENATDTELNIRLTSLVYKLDGWECTPMGTIFFHCGVDGGLVVAKVENVKATMFQIDQFSCPVFWRAMDIMSGNRKRAIMLYAEWHYEVNKDE